MRDMVTYWLGLLRDLGWDTPIGELTYTTTARDEDFTNPIYIDGKKVKRTSRDEGFKALGTKITFNISFDVELAFRRQFFYHF